ncbi:glycosyltransferase family 4 protein [Bacteroides difficilis]|uniref:glycosyltransferase family 4 protein n=1 Tax=Bacteroides difficilis TaxID=2763021 RepID=UPI003AAB9835
MKKNKYYICVTPFFPSRGNWRGAYILDQVKAIRRNSDYEIAVFMGGGDNEDYVIENIPVYHYKTREIPSNILNGFFNVFNAKSFVRKVIDVGIYPEDIAFVHCHVSMRAACGLALKKLNPNIKVLLQHHDLDPFNLRSGVRLRNNRINIRYRAKKAIELYNKVDLHICISEACKECLLQFPNPRKGEIYEDCIRSLKLCKGLSAINPKETYVLYNGVDTNLFMKISKVSETSRGIFRIGCVSNFNDLKDHITLIKAFEILLAKGYNNLRLSLLGTGEMRSMCEQYIVDHNLAKYIEWPKEVAHEKLPEYYQSLDLFVLPSYFEGFGCVYVEAAACGVPYMGCVNQGYSEYIPVNERDRWLIKPKDYQKLAHLISDYITLPQQQRLMHEWDIDLLIRKYLDYLVTLC